MTLPDEGCAAPFNAESRSVVVGCCPLGTVELGPLGPAVDSWTRDAVVVGFSDDCVLLESVCGVVENADTELGVELDSPLVIWVVDDNVVAVVVGVFVVVGGVPFVIVGDFVVGIVVSETVLHRDLRQSRSTLMVVDNHC